MVPSAAGDVSKTIRTYVIGFGLTPGDARIERIAIGGGTDNPLSPHRGFYAQNEAELAVDGGMTSGKSQLGAALYEVENTSARLGRLLDEVAGDAKAVAKRRDEILELIDQTAKPYFGDLGTMTYAAWLQRFV